MTDPLPAPRPAWQPFTFSGVAAFARAGGRRVLAALLAGGGLCGLFVMGAFHFGWMPVIHDAVQALPQTGEIRHGRLHWHAATPAVLAQSARLQIAVNAQDEEAAFGHESDLRVELRGQHWRVCGWLGCRAWPYPAGWILALNQPEVLPAWGAWRPFVHWGVLGAGVVGVVSGWLALATLGAAPLRLLAFYLDRAVSLGAAWRMLAVAWIPGGLFFGLAVFLYGAHQLHPVVLVLIGLTHPLVGAVYALGALAQMPRLLPGATTPRGNPFQSPPAHSASTPPGKTTEDA